MNHTDNDLSEIFEIEEEQSHRTTRRQTLLHMARIERKESQSFPSSIDIREMEGNIYLKSNPNINYEEIAELHKSKNEFLKRLRLSVKRVKFYAGVFHQKATLLLKILIELMSNFEKEFFRRVQEYEYLEEILNPWLDIVKNANITPEMINALELKKLNELSTCENEGNRSRGFSQRLCLTNLDFNNIEEKKNEIEGEGEIIYNESQKDINSEYAFNKVMFLKEHKSIITKNQQFLAKMSKWKANLRERINKMIKKQLYMELLDKIEQSFKHFSSVASIKIREVLEGENFFNDTNPENNLFVLEFRICNLMKKFREKIDQKIIFKLYSMIKEVESIIFNHHSTIQNKMETFNKVGILVFGKESWTSKVFFDTLFSQEPKKLDILRLISPSYKKYMRKHLKIKDDILISNLDSVDFFTYYQLRYHSKSPLILYYIECSATGMKGVVNSENKNPILCIDVK